MTNTIASGGANNTLNFNQHRNWHVFATGGVLYGQGLRQRDAAALDGLMTLRPSQVALWLSLHASTATTFGEALVKILAENKDALDLRGRYASWHRRWISYVEDRESWLQEDEELRLCGAWRSKDMTSGQRELVRVTATLLDLLIPVEMDRGAAADFLEEHGANLLYRMEA